MKIQILSPLKGTSLRYFACFEPLCAEESYDQVYEIAAILDDILNCSKCSKMTKVYLADSENEPSWLAGWLPKPSRKKTHEDISRFNSIFAGLCYS